MMRTLFVLNGPNLNMMGLRQPELYGTATLDDVRALCERVSAEVGFELFFAQSNAEHELVEWVHEAFRQRAAVVINPAGFSFASIPLFDALRMLATPIVEMHITNIMAREYEPSLVSKVAHTVLAGAGIYGYDLAIRAAHHLSTDKEQIE